MSADDRTRALSTGPLTLAVNLCDSWESRIGVRGELDIPGTARRAGSDADSRREIWHWFIALAMILLTIEWIVFARRMRV